MGTGVVGSLRSSLAEVAMVSHSQQLYRQLQEEEGIDIGEVSEIFKIFTVYSFCIVMNPAQLIVGGHR